MNAACNRPPYLHAQCNARSRTTPFLEVDQVIYPGTTSRKATHENAALIRIEHEFKHSRGRSDCMAALLGAAFISSPIGAARFRYTVIHHPIAVR